MAEKGYEIIGVRIKEGAIPPGTVVNGVMKEAWADDDYEKFTEWVDYTPEQIAAMEEAERRAEFDETAPERMETVESCLTALTSAFGEVS